MKADFTRDSFDPVKSFTRVLMQQGRVQLDADWNEQTSILLHYLRTLAADIIGPAGAPAQHAGFVIGKLDSALAVPNDFIVGAGRFYVDGYLVELASESIPYSRVPNTNNRIQVPALWADGAALARQQLIELLDSAKATVLITRITDIGINGSTVTVAGDLTPFSASGILRRVATYQSQPGLPFPATLPVGDSTVYLDVWERSITYVQDDSTREVALLGPDTAARAQTVWQLRVISATNVGGTSPFNPANPLASLTGVNRGIIKAMAKQPEANIDPCTLSPDARYRGPENQLYRVEIHTGGLASEGASFKWSRENGAVVFPIVRAAANNAVVLENLGRDDRFGISEHDWVEAVDDATELLGTARPLLQVQSIDRTSNTVTLSGPIGITLTKGNPNHPLLRRWDFTFGDPAEGGLENAGDNAPRIIEDSATWLNLENGIQIQFQKPATGQVHYRTGDYWLIPARTALADIEWPRQTLTDAQGVTTETPLAKPPDGIDHHFAQIGTITVGPDGQVNNASSNFHRFNPLP
ncbi:MAG: hypothetical protein C5B51_27320 [Terriglobia bacterium]|nr:MAG: hypothetical protein C5B51_27320 [Terriglobia bacterium]